MRTREACSLVSARRVAFASLICVTLLGACVACATAGGPDIPVGTVSIHPNLLRYFDRWHGESPNERAVALYGRRVGMIVVVEGFDRTKTLRSDSVSASFRFLERSGRIIGVLHNHPNQEGRPCVPSDRDLRTMYANRHLIALVACGDGRFGLALRGDPRYHRIQRRAP